MSKLDLQCQGCYMENTMSTDYTGLWAICNNCGFKMDLLRYKRLNGDDDSFLMKTVDQKERARLRRRGPYRKSWSP